MKGKMKSAARPVMYIIIWVVILAAALFPAIYINRVYGYLAVFFFALLLVLSQLILWFLKRGISVDTNLERTGTISCLRGEPVDLKLVVKNSSPFFCSHARAGFYISDLFGDADAVNATDFTIAARSDSKFEFDMDMRHIGVYKVGLRDLEIYDMFGFFRKKLAVNGDFEVFVKPQLYDLQDMVIQEEVYLESNKDTRNTVQNGIDYVGVREYTPGDSMKQIHWKLSAHSIGYLTKLSESSRQSDFAVVLDFSANKADAEEMMDLYDTLVETAFSILEVLAHREVTFSLVYADKQQQMRRSIPKGRDHDLEYIRRFDVMTPDPKPGYPDGAVLLQQEAKLPNRSTNIIMCTSRVTTELVQELISIKRKKRSPELYVMIPERLTQREREHFVAPLRALDDARVPWHLISTSRNLQKPNTANKEDAS